MITHIRISLEQFDIIDRIYRGIIFFYPRRAKFRLEKEEEEWKSRNAIGFGNVDGGEEN